MQTTITTKHVRIALPNITYGNTGPVHMIQEEPGAVRLAINTIQAGLM